MIGSQFWIDFFLPAVEYLKVFELLLHGRENELLKFFFVDFFVARAVLAFCPFGTAALKINAAALNGRINLSAVRRLFSFAVVRQNGCVTVKINPLLCRGREDL